MRKLQSEDHGSKVIIFVQWEDLLVKVQNALAECGLQSLRLRGTLYQRQQTLRLFEDSTSEEHLIMLLSLERSPSGMNLTVANHVFLLHPMLAESSEIAVGYERQAIGRVRRQGQHKIVHLWRFATEGTVEEDMVDVHRGILSAAAVQAEAQGAAAA